MDADAALRPSSRRKSTSSNEARDSGEYSGSDEKAAVTGILRTIQKPLSSIGRIFSDEAASSTPPTSGESAAAPGGPARTPQPEGAGERGDLRARQQLSAEEAAARQASAEAAEAQRLHRAEHDNIVETLAGMFPDLDREIISDVVYQKEGRCVIYSLLDCGNGVLLAAANYLFAQSRSRCRRLSCPVRLSSLTAYCMEFDPEVRMARVNA